MANFMMLDGAFLSIFSSKYGLNDLGWGIQCTDAAKERPEMPGKYRSNWNEGCNILGARAPSPAMSAQRETVAASKKPFENGACSSRDAGGDARAPSDNWLRPFCRPVRQQSR
jgi:hypothetical protein